LPASRHSPLRGVAPAAIDEHSQSVLPQPPVPLSEFVPEASHHPSHDPSPFAPGVERFRAAYKAVSAFVEARYGLPVYVEDVPAPFTGDLDGARIVVDHELSDEDALFIVAHLFGHTVQWNTNVAERELGSLTVTNPSPALLEQLAAYERRAASYAMQLFHEAGVHDLDQWLSDYSNCDIRYLCEFYRTGVKVSFKSCWENGTPLIEPVAIPDFAPARWRARSTGVVV
jgi:hypothetical protein